MSVVRRTLIALPAALVALLLFAATSREEWRAVTEDTIDAEIVLDEDGQRAGEVVVVVDPGAAEFAYDLRVLVHGEEARRSLRVQEGEAGDLLDPETAERVRDGAYFFRSLPGDCEESVGAESLELWPEVCTVRFPALFDGGKSKADVVRFSASIGAWSAEDSPEGLAVQVDWVE